MSDQIAAWERWYRNNPINWKGSPLPLPKLSKSARVLDVGCGTGNTVLQALEMEYQAVGLDISRLAIERAGERISSRGFDPELYVGDLLDPDLNIGRFDCIMLHHVLDNMLVKDRGKAVERALDLLMNDGLISFQDFSVKDMRFGKGEAVENNTYRKGDGLIVHFFTMEEVRGLFRNLEEIELTEHSWKQGREMVRSRIGGTFQVPSFITRGSTSGA